MEFLLYTLFGIAGGAALASFFFLLWRKRGADLDGVAEARDYAEALIDNLPYGVLVLDEDMTILRISDAYCRITRRTKEDLIGRRPPYPGWPNATPEQIKARMDALLRGEARRVELTYVRPDGTEFPAEFSFSVVRTGEGRVHFLVAIHDLTELKRREETVRESEEKFRRMAELSTDAIYQLDLTGKVTYCSPAVERVLGYTQAEFTGTDFRSHIAPEDRPEAEDLFARSLRGEEIRHGEVHLQSKDGRRVCLQINAAPMRREGVIVGSQGIARDMTVPKQAEEALRVSEARLRTVIESIPFDFFFIDEDGRYAMQNPAMERHWGWDLVGKRPDDYAPDEETLALWLDNNRRAFAGEVVEGEVSFPVAGEVRDFYNIISPVREKGRITGILGVNIDISDRKRMERALRESEEKYRFLVENTGTAVTLWDAGGELLFINGLGAGYLGRAPEELIGKSVTEVAGKEAGARARSAMKAVLASGVAVQHENSVDLPVGRRWFRSFLQPVRDSEGRLFGLQVVSHDITELMRAERSLREQDARLRLMVSQLPAVVWTIDRELRFTSSAGAGLAALNLQPGQAVGKTLYEYFNTTDSDFLPIAMHRRALEGEATMYEMKWDGSIWETKIEPLRDETGEIIGCLAIALDISERKQAETELNQSKEALRALAGRLQRVREEESTSIAREIHDELGQSLTGIKLGLSFIRRRLPLQDQANARSEADEKIDEMNKEIDTTINTVRRISAQLRPKILDDLDLIGAIEWQAQDFSRRTGVVCNVNSYCRAGDLPLDQAPATAVFRIFQEILTNVSRHAEARHVFVDLRCEEDAFVLDVRDDGKGIPRSRLRRLEGLGILGMRERALAFGGRVDIDSEPGKGTAVKVTIPQGKES